MLGVHKLIGESAVIGKQEQTLRIQVQTSHGVYTNTAIGYQFRSGASSLLIGQGGHKSTGFIEHDVHRFITGRDGFSIDANIVHIRIGRLTQQSHHTIDADSALFDHLFCSTAGSNPTC